MGRRLTAKERALPGQLAEADRRLSAVEACADDDALGIDEAASYLAQFITATGVQPDWGARPVGARRYDRLRFPRGAWYRGS